MWEVRLHCVSQDTSYPNNINDPEISLNHDNLEYLCLDCHNEHHDFEREKKPITRNEFKFNNKGEIVKA